MPIVVSDDAILKLVESVAGIKVGQEALSEKLDQTHERLFGNGQPGELALIRSRVDSIEKHAAEVRGAVKTLKVTGGVVTGVFGLFETVFHALFGKH